MRKRFSLCGILVIAALMMGAKSRPAIDPYLQTGRGAKAREALRNGAASVAVSTLKTHLATSSDQALQARFLLAYAQLKAGDNLAAAAEWKALSTDYPLLAAYHLYYQALALSYEEKYNEALDIVSSLATRDDVSALRTDLTLLRARCLGKLQQHAEAAALWQMYLGTATGTENVQEAQLRLGEAKLQQISVDMKTGLSNTVLREAAGHFRAVISHGTPSLFYDQAAAYLKQIAARVPEGQAIARLTPEEQFYQAQRAFSALQNETAERLLKQILGASSGVDAKLRCRAQYTLAKTVMRQRQRNSAIELFEQARKDCRAAEDAELQAASLFNGGRSLRAKGMYPEAMEIFLELARDYPTDPLADDALFQAADTAVDLQQHAEANQILQTLVQQQPNGDRARDATWRLARIAYLDGRYGEALNFLNASALMADPTRQDEDGDRECYWKARTLEKLRKHAEALKTYDACAIQNPLTYYALLSYRRLHQIDRAASRQIYRSQLAPIHSPTDPANHPIPEPENSAEKRALELARLGFSDFAWRELKASRDPANALLPEAFWTVALVFHEAEQWNLSLTFARRNGRSFRGLSPNGEHGWRWTIAFPKAFTDTVARYARKRKIPSSLVWAIMREESSFSPRIESQAGAIGLMQLMLHTAQRVAKEDHTSVNEESLRDPEVNIRLGTHYLRTLSDNLKGNLPLVIASYNAGPRAVQLWLERYPDQDLDMLIELIPYEETRRYTRRVLASFFAYQALYEEDKVPTIDFIAN